MHTARSADGTTIAFDRAGSGPPVVLVDGALCSRRFGPMGAMSAQLASRFTVFSYDRRGRGDSADAPSWSVDREVEDLSAIIDAAGGSAFVFGVSSGAALSLEAAARGLPITKLALYEAPFIVDDSHPPLSPDFIPNLKSALADGRRGAMVSSFMTLVGVPAIGRAVMRVMPVWSKLKAVAHTLPYDLSIVEPFQQGRPLPADRWSGVTMPTWVGLGGRSPAWMQHAMQSLARALPSATLHTLEGQTHMVKAGVVAPALVAFFGDR
jgi:pimeloyl-ACP methyl ester carboxylesterase